MQHSSEVKKTEQLSMDTQPFFTIKPNCSFTHFVKPFCVFSQYFLAKPYLLTGLVSGNLVLNIKEKTGVKVLFCGFTLSRLMHHLIQDSDFK